MKPYGQVVDDLAKRKYHEYMSGENDLRIPGMNIVADIYEVSIHKLNDDVDKKFRRLNGTLRREASAR